VVSRTSSNSLQFSCTLGFAVKIYTAAIQTDFVGIVKGCGNFLRKGEVFACVGRNQSLKDLVQVGWGLQGAPAPQIRHKSVLHSDLQYTFYIFMVQIYNATVQKDL